MRRAAVLFFLFLLISGCGSKAPDDAVVTGPGDESFTVQGGGGLFGVGPVEFTVKNSLGAPLPDIDIEFFGGGGAILTDRFGNTLNAVNPGYFKTKTDDGGFARVFYVFTLPSCTSTTDLTRSASVFASVRSSASKLSTATVTIKCS